MTKRAASSACPPGDFPGQLEIHAIDLTAGSLSDDPYGIAALWDRVRQLADEPRPAESFPYGSPDVRRLRAGRYRVFYQIDDDRQVIQIDHVGRI